MTHTVSNKEVTSDVKFHEIFWHEIFHEIFREIFLKYFFKSRRTMNAGCLVHCNKVSKPVKGKYLLLCMNNIMHFLLHFTLLTFLLYTLIMFLTVLSHF